MLNKKKIKRRKIGYAIAAAVAYLVMVFLFFNHLIFTQAWILYVGNVLFGIIVSLYLITYNKNRSERASVYGMVKAGHIVTAIGILISCIVIGILLFFQQEHLFDETIQENLVKVPSQMKSEENHGLIFMLFLDAVVGNIAAGSFVSIMFPFALTKMQKGEAEPSGNLK